MRKTNFCALSAAAVMTCLVGFASCDKEDENDTFNDSGVNKVLTGVTHSSALWASPSPFSYSFTYDNDKMSSHRTTEYTTTFSYEGSNVIKSQIIIDSTNTVCIDNTYYLNEDGTVNKRVCFNPEYPLSVLEEFYVYNNNKQITEVKQGENILRYKYDIYGALTEIIWEDGAPYESFVYTNSIVKTPIKNKAHLRFNTLLDDYSLLDVYGNTYSYLPVGYHSSYHLYEFGLFDFSITFDWTLDGDGYPISMKETKQEGAVDDYMYDFYSFSWKTK